MEHRNEKTSGATSDLLEPLTPQGTSYQLYYPQQQATNSLYGEADVPLVTSKNEIPGVALLELQLADRIEWYSVDSGSQYENVYPNASPPSYNISPTPLDANSNGSGGTPENARSHYSSNNQTFGIKYKPLDDVTLRASQGTAFLPPTHSQLLTNPAICALCDTITDPKNPGAGSYQVNTITGGNPDLLPQHSKNWDLGLIYEPMQGLFRGLRVDLERYQITQFGYITSISGNQILNDPALAGRVTRSPTTGLVTEINESLINATEFKTKGWDLALNYHIPTTIGTFNLRGAATRIDHNLEQFTVDSPSYDYAGAPLSDGGQDKWKANGSVSWANQRWVVNWNTTWYGSYPAAGSAAELQVGGSINPTLLMAQGSDHIPSQIYHDLFVSYGFGQASHADARPTWGASALDGLKIELSVHNVFNKLPPFEAYSQPFYASYFGSLRLRDFQLSLIKQF